MSVGTSKAYLDHVMAQLIMVVVQAVEDLFRSGTPKKLVPSACWPSAKA